MRTWQAIKYGWTTFWVITRAHFAFWLVVNQYTALQVGFCILFQWTAINSDGHRCINPRTESPHARIDHRPAITDPLLNTTTRAKAHARQYFLQFLACRGYGNFLAFVVFDFFACWCSRLFGFIVHFKHLPVRRFSVIKLQILQVRHHTRSVANRRYKSVSALG